jgi:hypothetical protein
MSMTLLERMLATHPLSGATFLRWLETQNVLRPITPFLRTPVEELPIELLYGILFMFFDDQGVMIHSKGTTQGRRLIRIHMKGYTGRYRLSHEGNRRLKSKDFLEDSVKRAFTVLENKIASAIKPPPQDVREEVLIGLDVEDIMEMARQKELKTVQKLYK